MLDPAVIDDTAILHAIPFPALLMTPELEIIDANAGFSDAVMRPRDRLLGKALFEEFPEGAEGASLEPAIRRSVARALETGQADIVEAGRHDIEGPDGTYVVRYWRLRHTVVRPGSDNAKVLQIVEDVTDQSADKAMQLVRERIASEGANLAFWDIDLETGTLLRSAAVDSMHGFAEGEAGDSVVPFFERIHPDDRERCEGTIWNAARADPSRLNLQYRIVLPGGTQRWLMTQAEIIKDINGTGNHLAGIVVDVTDAHRSEEDLRAAVDAYRTLLNEVNHRVKNSLQMVASILNLESNRSEGAAREKLIAAGARVGAIATIHSGLYLDDDVTSIEIERQIVALCRHLANSADCARRGIDIAVEVLPIRLPPDRAIGLSLVVNELVTNSLRHGFGPEGSGRIEVALRALDPGQLELTVCDNGAGAAPEGPDLQGLGLRLIRMAAEQFGGRVEQHPRAEGWATSLTFPREA